MIKQLYASVKDQCILNSFVMQDMLYPASAKLLANHMQGLAPSYMYYFDYLTKNIRRFRGHRIPTRLLTSSGAWIF